jgi:hypothetical protein
MRKVDFVNKIVDSLIGKNLVLPIMEGGYSKMMRILRGLDKSVTSMGIVTAENPKAQALPSSENKKRNYELEKKLRENGIGYFQIRGKYGSLENPFFVENVSRDQMVDLAREADQESVIWGRSLSPEYDGFQFELVGQDGSTLSSRRVALRVGSDQEDFYSEYKGRRFSIPFFDDDYSKAQFKGGSIERS